ncbi:rhodanese-like domain-containing protein [Flavobacterium hiemivividum]|uniref:Rhodanese-like domain-containing protein n=1 Tax=Flavobacterium hiemivividum TaxID=2541734 RepID=A0A4R5CTE8_9FLAO|nr:rhodanese-like domain-containing protein [Flavobacterium hiemivividum]TDE03586.1 rhodanese-like domain-containing protein [Flavobacterium hiemivividum]
MRHYIYFIAFLFSITLHAQNNIEQALKKFNKETVPYIKVNELKEKKNLVFLDAREPQEYKVSHIQNAIPVGFDHFNSKKVTANLKDKNATIIVYCSIGVRSEQIGEKLQKLGYKNVYNLYGGIFEYKNNGEKVVNNQNKVTDSIHTYNKAWSIYLKKGIKVYEN